MKKQVTITLEGLDVEIWRIIQPQEHWELGRIQ